MKLYFKKLISHLLIISVLTSMFAVSTPITAQAVIEERSYSARYEGEIDSAHYCVLDIYGFGKNENGGKYFNGHLKVDGNMVISIPFVGKINVGINIDDDVQGSVAYYPSERYYYCTVNINKSYYGLYDMVCAFKFKIYPDSGIVEAEVDNNGLFLVSYYNMTGTVDPHFFDDEVEKDDLKLCMRLSNAAYEEKLGIIGKVKKVFGIEKELYTPFSNEFGDNIITNTLMSALIQEHEKEHLQYIDIDNKKYDGVLSLNYGDDNKDNSPVTVTRRENTNGTVDIFVILRGTFKDEWQGNTELTGEEYNPNQVEHDNFYKAKDSIKDAITIYYKEIRKTYAADKINLIITGHSRGAAVANIYAKEATDVMNNRGNYENIPKFHKVTAYTFACPNVHKYEENMEENYPNIFNYCIYEDIVPTVPLTKPAAGWNYWKYGHTYTISSVKNVNIVDELTPFDLKFINYFAPNQIHHAFSQWKSVDEYYNKILTSSVTPENPHPSYTTLFEYLHTASGKFMAKNEDRKALARQRSNNRNGIYIELAPLLTTATVNLASISAAHDYESYNYFVQLYGRNGLERVTYNDVTDLRYHSSVPEVSLETTPTYAADELTWLRDFAMSYDNNQKLGWDLSDPASWEGIYWTADGHVYGIELPFKNLQGRLEIARFPQLQYLFVSGNQNMYLAPIYDHSELIMFDGSFCSYDNDTLDIQNCPKLEDVRCIGTKVKKTKIKNSPKVKKVNLAENEITEIEVTSNVVPDEVDISGNFIEMPKFPGTPIRDWIDAIVSDGGAVEDFPQKVPATATYNAAEMQALKAFAQIGNNNEVLGLLDENGNINTQALQFYALFEYDGSEYRVVSLDIAGIEVSGALNLGAFTKLRSLFCENTKLTALDVSGCTELETMYCYDAELSTLTVPSNAADASSKLLDVDCEYNYLYTPVFTPEMVNNITAKPDASLEYLRQKGDRSTLEAVLEFGKTLEAKDYSKTSYEAFQTVYENAEKAEGYLLTQVDIDEIVTEVLTAINELEPYLNLKVSSSNGTVTTVYNDKTQSGSSHSLQFGTPVTVTATANEGYTFDGWYETITQRKFSSESTYTFKITTNMELEARFIRTGNITLTFTNDTGQVVSKIDKSMEEWSEITNINELLPAVPYKLGHTNGRWNYTAEDVLTALQAGNDVTIAPVYDESAYEYPEIPTPVDNTPVLKLHYNLDADNKVGSFTMAAGIPQGLHVEAIGVGFYCKKAEDFNPSNFILNINNKMLTSRFDGVESDGIYVVNVGKFTSYYNWCARGYITYYDENNELKTVYSNQINIVDRQQIG